MINSKTIWTFAIGVSISLHLIIFAMYLRDVSSYGDGGYLEVELSLEEPKDDRSSQTMRALPKPATPEPMPTMPEQVELPATEIDLLPTTAISPPEVAQLPDVSFEFDSSFDTFDLFGDSTAIYLGTGTRDESARARGTETVETRYLKRITARIHRFKQYPREARIAKEEGTVIIQLTLQQDGSVSDKKITSSSGIELLDIEALEIISRADPLPKFPSALIDKIGSQITFRTKINFALNDTE